MPKAKYTVLGGYGAMGSTTVRDLFESNKNNEIIIAGRNKEKIDQLVKKYNSPRVKGILADVNNKNSLIKAFKGSSVVINAVQYELNLKVMMACLASKTNYIDLGGLFHMTRKQLELHSAFKKKNILAVLGIGAAPGTTNILARYGADKLDKVSEIHIKLGYADFTKVYKQSPLSSSYSLQTILEEFSYKPAIFTNGIFKFVEPMSGAEPYKFPKPVGIKKPMYTLHSEVATLPLTYKSKGIKEASFKIAFDEDFTNKIRFLRDIGLASEKPIKINGTKIKPRDFLLKLVNSLPKPKTGKPKEYEIIRVIVRGKKGNKNLEIINDCHVKGMPRWNIGIDIDTGVPPSITAQMIANGIIKEKGVLPPEKCVEPELYFNELKKRYMIIKVKKSLFEKK